MGTTLTGLTPATTYDALIKVGDNGPLSATAKYVGDGLGNDSVVALSTSSVGIGTTSPTQLLHVAGNVRITGALYDGNNAAGTSGQILSSTGTGTDWVSKSDLSLVDGSGTANYVSKWSDTDTLTNSVIYDNGTNVGIGTAAPTYKLQADITDATAYSSANTLAASPVFWVNNNSSTAGTAVTIRLDGGTLGGNAAATISSVHVGSGSSALTFGTRNANSDITERMRITSAGNVGIGTSSPTDILHLNRSGASVYNAIHYTNPNSTADFYVGIGGSSTLNSSLQNNAYLYNAAASAIVFATSDTERMKLDASGNLSITTGNIALSGAGGIYFDSGASKYLDDYEVGTWTPASNSAGYTLSSSDGSYTKIGRQVTIRGRVNFSAVNASSTSLFIFTGLPFSPSSEYQGVCRENTDLGSIFMAQVRSVPDGILNSMDAVTTGSNVQFATSRNYIFTITYFV